MRSLIALIRVNRRAADLDRQIAAKTAQLIDPLHRTDPDAYCAKYGIDRDALLREGRERVARDRDAHLARIDARIARAQARRAETLARLKTR